MGIKREGFGFGNDKFGEDFTKEFESMQRNVKKAQKVSFAFAIVGGIAGLAFFGTLIWAIIRVVKHLT